MDLDDHTEALLLSDSASQRGYTAGINGLMPSESSSEYMKGWNMGSASRTKFNGYKRRPQNVLPNTNFKFIKEFVYLKEKMTDEEYQQILNSHEHTKSAEKRRGNFQVVVYAIILIIAAFLIYSKFIN